MLMKGRRIASSSFARFLVVGVGNTAVHYLVFLSVWRLVPYLAAHLMAATVATSVSYSLNCRYTFRVRPTLRKFVLYPLSNLTNLGLSTLAVYLLVEGAHVDSRIATLLGGVIAVPATFLVSRCILVARPAAGCSPSEKPVARSRIAGPIRQSEAGGN